MTKKELNEIGIKVFRDYLENAEGLNIETIEYLGATKDPDDWDDYHDAWVEWTCPEKEAFLANGGDYLDFLDEHGLNYYQYIDTDEYTIAFCC